MGFTVGNFASVGTFKAAIIKPNTFEADTLFKADIDFVAFDVTLVKFIIDETVDAIFFAIFIAVIAFVTVLYAIKPATILGIIFAIVDKASITFLNGILEIKIPKLSKTFLAVLGRQPEISLAELEAEPRTNARASALAQYRFRT